MTVSFTIPSSQSFASGDCIQVALQSNPYLPVGTYQPFTTTAGCTISSGPSPQNCSIPSSATSKGQILQVQVGSTSTSGSIVASFKSTNPFSQRPLTYIVGYLKGCTGTVLGQQTIQLNFKQGTIGGMTLSSNSVIVGNTNSVLTVTFTVGTFLWTTGRIELYVPILYNPGDGSINPIIDASTTAPQVTSNIITITKSSMDTNKQLLTVDFTTGTTLATGSTVTFSVSNLDNPINYTSLSGFQISTYEVQSGGTNALIDQSSAVYSLSIPGLSPQTLKNGAVNIVVTNTNTADFTIGQANRDLLLYLEVDMPLLQNQCFLKVNFPPEIMIDVDSTLNSVICDGFMTGCNTAPLITPYTTGTGDNFIILSGCSTVQTGYSQTSNVRFQTIVSPGQIKEVTGFSLFLATDIAISNILATGTNQQGFMIPKSSFIGGSITSMSFSVSKDTNGDNFVQEKSEYTVSFAVATNLYSNSVIEVVMPTYVTSISNAPVCSVSGLLASCATSSSGTSVLISNPFTQNSVQTAGWDFKTSNNPVITLKINGGTNPISVKDAGAWKATTYNTIGGQKYVVDTGSATTSFTPQSGTLTEQSPVVVVPAATSQTGSTYTFNITLSHSIPAQGLVLITIPSDISISSTSMLSSSCQYLPPSAPTSPLQQTCSVSSNQVTMQLSVAHSKANTLQIQLRGFLNPRTLKPTSSFTISTQDKDQTQIDNMASSAAFIATMTTLASITDMSVTATNLTNGAQTSYIISFVSPIALMAFDVVTMTLDSNIKPISASGGTSGQMQCIGVSQITTINCQFSGTTLTVTLSGVTSAAGTYAFNLTNVINPPSTRLYNVIPTAVLVDHTGNKLMSLPSTITVMLQTQLPANILTYSLNQASLTSGALTKYTITFKTTNPISNQGSFTLTWPSQVSIPTQQTVKCTVTTYQQFTSNCNFIDLTRTIVVVGVFGQSTTIPYSGTVTIVLDSMNNPPDNRAINGFIIATYDDALQTYKIDKLDDNLMMPQTLCNFPCSTCSLTDRNNCQSCWSGMGLPFLQTYTNGTGVCKQSCDPGYTTNGATNQVCVACDQSCTQCVDNGQIGDMSRCIVCAPNFNYQFTATQKCMQSCSSGYYQSSPFICSLCASNCLTCNNSASNCTSCNPKNPQFQYFYNYQCIDTCPTGYVNSGSQCLKCDATCSACKNTTTTCTSCDTSSTYKYFFGYQCLSKCPAGTLPDNSSVQCIGCLQGCKLCDSKNQTKCLSCEAPLLEYNGDCLNSCPAGTQVSFFMTSCTKSWSINFNFPNIPYPHLCACAFMTLLCLVSMVKSRKSLFITNMLVLWSPVEFVSFISLTYFGTLFSTYKYASASGIAVVSYFILNLACMLSFEMRIARKDIEYLAWRDRYPKSSRVIIIFSTIFSFKILRLHYSHLFGFDAFKAGFQYPGVFQRQIIIFTIVHFIFSNCIILGVDIVGLFYLPWGTQLTTTMQETAAISVILIILDLIELSKLKHYLGDDIRVDYDSLVNQMNETMDKKLRQDMLKQIMNHVRGNRDLKLNNRFDDLLTEMGPRRCQSMIDFGNDLEDDPRRTQSCPVSPREKDDFLFDKDAMLPTLDNVYAESKPADPLGNVGKTFTDFDAQVLPKDFDKILSRKGGDFVNFESNDPNQYKRTRKNKPRGRKNQYYTQIDEEDDEEADKMGQDEEVKDGDDLDVIKEEEDLEEIKRLKKEKKRLYAIEEQKAKEEQDRLRLIEEKEKLRQQQEAEESIRRQKAEKERVEREVLEKQFAENEAIKQAELAKKKKAEEEEKQRLKQQEEKDKAEKERIRLEQQRLKEIEEQRMLQQKLQEDEKERIRQDEERKRAEMEKEFQRIEDEKQKKEQEDRERKLKEEQEAKKLEDEIAQQQTMRAMQQEASQQQKPLTAGSAKGSVSNEVMMNTVSNLQAFQTQADPIVQVPPDFQKRNFNENDILGDFDRDEKGNVVVLQDDSGLNIDKQGRKVNERGYLQDAGTGDIIENYQNQKMFSQADIDERGEVPAPFCVEKFNFNPLSVRGDFDFDKSGRIQFVKGKKAGELLDKRGKLVNKKGWLIDEHGNICDQNGRKKFDKKQLTSDQDFPRLFNLNGRRYDIIDVCGQLSRDQQGNLIFKKNKKGQAIDNLGRLVNERGYLIDEHGNIIDREKKKMFEKRFLKNSEFPKIFPFTKFNIKRVQGNFEMDPLGNPILDRSQDGNFFDRDGKRVNNRGYLIDYEGNVIDKLGKRMFEKEILDAEGEIPKVFRTGLLKSDTASSLSRLMSEIEKNQPSEYGNPQWRRNQKKQDQMNQLQQRKEQERQQDAMERLSGNTSVDSMMEDTPSNYNIANQRFDQTNELLNAKSQQLQQQNQHLLHQQQMAVDEVQEEDSQFDGDFAGGDTSLKKKRIKKKKKVIQVYNDPSAKDIKLARAYGGVPKGAPKRVIPQTIYRDTQTPGSVTRGSRQNIQKVSGTVTGFQRDAPSRGNLSSMQYLEELKDENHTASLPGMYTNQSQLMNESNEASFLAVPEHHLREQKLKQKKLHELKARGRGKKKRGAAGDPDFEKMFGKDIDEFLEDSDWDIESYENMSNYSKGTSRSVLHQDGRIRGLESIYLQRIETSMKKAGQQVPPAKKQKKQEVHKFRPMQDRFMNDPSQVLIGEGERARDPSSSVSQSRMQRPQFVESANTTGIPQMRIGEANIFQKQTQRPAQNQYRNGPDPSKRTVS